MTHLYRRIGMLLLAVCPRVVFVQDLRELTLRIIKTMTSLKNFQKTQIIVGDICQKGKTRIANIYDQKGKPIKIVLSKECTLRTPWNVSAYDGGSRCSLDIMMNEELHNLVNKIDSDVFNAICKESNR